MSVNSGSLLAVLLVASALTGCERRNVDDAWDVDNPVRYCVDADGHRVRDENCQTTSTGVNGAFLWYYLNSMNNQGRYYVPPVGAVASGGSYTPAAGVPYASVARGGFGGTGEGGDGHGEGGGE